jgi:hypothetical protein
MLQITGKLKVKGNEQVISDRFRKREFVITDDSSQYPQHISFQLTQDKCSLLDPVNIGDEITIAFNLRGREWTSPQGEVKYFNSLEAWKIDRRAAGSAPSYDHASIPEANEMAPEAKDDLPF